MQQSQLPCSFERRVLTGRELLGRAHPFPGGERVAMIVVDPEMFELDFATCEWQVSYSYFNARSRTRHVIVVVVPDQNAKFVLVEAGTRRNIRFVAHAPP